MGLVEDFKFARKPKETTMNDQVATLSRSRWNWNRIRTIDFWVTTFVVVFELSTGSVWNLLQIEWITGGANGAS
jgi:hypothetical protein